MKRPIPRTGMRPSTSRFREAIVKNVRDPGATLAKELGAQYATYSVVLDADGRVRYHGGIDSDKNHLHDDATPYLRAFKRY